MADDARLRHARPDRPMPRRHRDRRARRRGDQAPAVARAPASGVHAGARSGGRARRAVRQRDLRGPGPVPAVRRVRQARRGGPAVRGPPGHRVHGLPDGAHPRRRGRDRGRVRRRRPHRRAARAAVRCEPRRAAGGRPGAGELHPALRRAAGGAGRRGRRDHRGPRRRLLPGDGELPLLGLLAALPAGIPVAVEAPAAGAGARPAEFAIRARRALSSVLSRAELSQAKERPS